MTKEQAAQLIDEFDKWIVATKRGDKLSKLERATIDTFLYFLLVARQEASPKAVEPVP